MKTLLAILMSACSLWASQATFSAGAASRVCVGGSPDPCAVTDVAYNPVYAVPNIGGLSGAGTLITDPFQGATILRVTDYNTLASPPPNASFAVDAGGSAEVNPMSSDDAYFYVTDSGTRMEPYQWNGVTMQATLMYSSYNGGRQYFGAGGEFSYTVPGRLYWLADGSTNPCNNGVSGQLCIAQYDLTQASPTYATVKDLGADSNCYPAALGPVDGTVTWADPVIVSADDQTFETAWSNTGGQGTGVTVTVWNRTNGCRWWRTDTGNAAIGGAWGATGIPTTNGGTADTFTVHNARLNKNATWVEVTSGGSCSGACDIHYVWNLSTLNNNTANFIKSGHEAVSYLNLFISPTCPFQNSFSRAALASPANACSHNTTLAYPPCLANCTGGAASPAEQASWDSHISATNQNATDKEVAFASSLVCNAPCSTPFTPAQAWNFEILGFDPSGSGKAYRFARNYSTGVTTGAAQFPAENAIGSISADGKWFLFSSDWGGTLGSQSGGTTCINNGSGYNCRADVFLVKIQ